MPDLDSRFELLDRLHAPDLWPDVAERRPADKVPGSSHRLAVAVLALVVAAAGVGVGVWAIDRQTTPPSAGRPVPIIPKANGLIVFLGSAGKHVLGPQAVTDLYVQRPDGSGRRRLAHVGQVLAASAVWSPDGRRVAYVLTGDGGGSELHIVDAGGRNDRVIMNREGLGLPTWSPDGRQLAVPMTKTGRRYDLWGLNADGRGIHPITNGTADVAEVDWSPDGTRILFSASRASEGGATVLSTVRPDGSDLRTVFSSAHFLFSPRWSPDGKRIAFIDSQGQDHPSELDLIGADGSQRKTVLECETDCLLDSSWSPDGTELLFSRFDGSRWWLWEIHPDGTHLRKVDTGRLQACCASWQPVRIAPSPTPSPAVSPTPPRSGVLQPTPSGHEGNIVYVAGDGTQLWVMGPDGSQPHRIGTGTSPAWSPDGSLIAFKRWRPGARFDLDVMNTDGMGVRTIVAGVPKGTVGLMAPAWSPDGHSLAFASPRGLEVVDVDGTGRRVIAARKDCLEASPAWSPDGGSIAFIEQCSEAQFEAQDGIVLIAPDGTGWQRIVGPAGFAAFPPSRVSWSPDGSYLAFATENESGGTMYLVRADGSGLVRFGSGMEPTWSSDGARIAFVQRVGVNHDGLAIETIGVDGSGRRRLTPPEQVASQPDWQR